MKNRTKNRTKDQLKSDATQALSEWLASLNTQERSTQPLIQRIRKGNHPHAAFYNDQGDKNDN